MTPAAAGSTGSNPLGATIASHARFRIVGRMRSPACCHGLLPSGETQWILGVRPNAVGLSVLDADALDAGSDTAGFLDEVTLADSRITWEYQPTGTRGKPVGPAVTGGWDLRTN